MPHEAKFFEMLGQEVLPLDGFGYNEEVRVIVTFQIPDKVCPFLRNNKCSIYFFRPWSCRAYPITMPAIVTPSICTENGIYCLQTQARALLSFDERCPFSHYLVKQYPYGEEITEALARKHGFREERKYAWKIADHLVHYARIYRQGFRYDLETNEWFKIYDVDDPVYYKMTPYHFIRV